MPAALRSLDADCAWHPAMPINEGGLPEHQSELYSRKTSHRAIFSWPASAGWCCAWHPAMPINEGGLPEHRSELCSRKTRHPVVFAWPASAGWCGAWHPAMPINEGGLPEHRSEHQAPRRTEPTIIPDATAEPPSERSVFGEPARRVIRERSVFGETARLSSRTDLAPLKSCVPARTIRAFPRPVIRPLHTTGRHAR